MDSSRRRFRPRPGVDFFVFVRAQVSERRVLAFCVVDALDEAGKISGHILEAVVLGWVDGLDLQRLHEALGMGIVCPLNLLGLRRT